MGQPGTGAIVHYLGGGSENDAAKYIGKAITGAVIKDDRLNVDFEDGTKISIWDNGQSCCESRYMTTDDDVAVLVGGELVNIEAKPGIDMKESEYDDEHETVFVEVQTDKGFITVVNHNQHNGYYGGFGLTITEREE